MNVKLLSLVFIALVLTVAVSGCTSTAPDSTGEEQVTPQQENEVVNDLDSELIGENEEIDTGEMI